MDGSSSEQKVVVNETTPIRNTKKKEMYDFTNLIGTQEEKEDQESESICEIEEREETEIEEKKEKESPYMSKQQKEDEKLLTQAKVLKTVENLMPERTAPIVAKIVKQVKKEQQPKPLRCLLWNTCRGFRISYTKRIEVLKKFEKLVDMILLIDTDVQEKTINLNTPTKETKRKLSIPGWSLKLKKMDKNIHVAMTKDSRGIRAFQVTDGIELLFGENRFLLTYFPDPRNKSGKERLERIQK